MLNAPLVTPPNSSQKFLAFWVELDKGDYIYRDG